MGLTRGANFATGPRRNVGVVAAITWGIGLCLAGVLGWSWTQVSMLRTETVRLAGHAERLERETKDLERRAESAPSAKSISEQAAKVQRINLLTGPRRLPLTAVLGLLEAELPETVRVSQLGYDAETGRLNISLQAREEAELPPALRQLEALDEFGSVILERQVRVQQGNETLVQYDVQAVTR